jgi:hypothetical protein
MPSKHGPHTTCGSRAFGSASRRRRRVGAGAAYLRWSPDGTAWDYLHSEDSVELRCHGPRGFAGVTVVASRTVAAGEGGWIEEGALAR